MEKTLNTVIVLRNDKSTDWATSKVILKEGEVGVSYLDNGNVVVKAGDGVNEWSQLKQVEGVFEQPVTLTQNFGYFTGVPTGGYKTFNETAGMTTSEFILAALKKTVEPTIVQPSCSMSASAVIENSDKEIGAKITGIKWDGSTSNGSYKVGSGSDQGTGITSGNFSWAISNNIDSQKSTGVDGTFTLTSDKYIQINSETEATYATISATVTLDTSGAKDPKNNLGEATSGKITTASAGSPWSKSAAVKVTGYRKPFWGWKSTADSLADPAAITAAQIRALGKSGTSTAGLPTSLTVPAGTKQIFFAAKAGTKSSLTVKNVTKEPATGVACTKVAGAVIVPGANNYGWNETSQSYTVADGACSYDLWYINLDAAFTGETNLSLTWA